MGWSCAERERGRAEGFCGDEQSLFGEGCGECAAVAEHVEGGEGECAGAAAGEVSGVGEDCGQAGGAADAVSDGVRAGVGLCGGRRFPKWDEQGYTPYVFSKSAQVGLFCWSCGKQPKTSVCNRMKLRELLECVLD